MNSELTFQAIVESSTIATLLVNKEGQLSYVNSYAAKLFGYQRQEMIGQAIEMLIPHKYHGHHVGNRDGFMDRPHVMNFDASRNLMALRKNGSQFPVEISLAPIVTSGGTLILASLIDISARKNAEEQFRSVVESAPNAIVVTGSDGKVTLVNTEAEKLFGYTRSELIGSPSQILIPSRFRKKEGGNDMFYTAPSQRLNPGPRELFAIKKDGREFPVEMAVSPIENPDGDSTITSIIDITERKKSEVIIKKQLIELQLKNREMEQFNYIASHDLQEPLRTVSNYIEMLEEDYEDKLDDEVKESLNMINAAVSRMSLLVRSILDYGRLGRNKTLALINCGEVVNTVLSDLEYLIQNHSATITVEPLPILPAYETELRQLFQNLINNAIKFRKKDVAPVIAIGYSQTGSTHEFYITDNGIGIEPKHFERIFHIFQRLHKEDEFEGNGIGLANCKKIVDMHGGRIWIESQHGLGTTFKFTLAQLSND